MNRFFNFKLLKFIPLFTAFGAVVLLSNKSPSINCSCLGEHKSLNANYDLATAEEAQYYGTAGGYFDLNKLPVEAGTLTDSQISPFTTSDGMFFVGRNDDGLGLLNITSEVINNGKAIKVHAPYFVPAVKDITKGSPINEGCLYRYLYFKDVSEEYIDYWTEPKLISGNGLGQLSYETFQAIGIDFDGVKHDITSKLSETFIAHSYQNEKKAVQGLTLTLNDSSSLYDFETVKITFKTISYTSFVYNEKDGSSYIAYEDVTTHTSVSPTTECHPSSRAEVASGQHISNATTVDTWYEAPKAVGQKGSFKTSSAAIPAVKGIMQDDAEYNEKLNVSYDITEKGFIWPTTAQGYEDSFGNSSSYNFLKAYKPSQFEHGDSYDIYVVPEYTAQPDDPSLKPEVTELYALRQDDVTTLDEFLSAQVLKLIKTCTVFKDINPADPFLDVAAENVLFDQYDVYRNASIFNRGGYALKYLGPDTQTFTTVNVTAGATTDLEPNTFNTFGDIVKGSEVASYRHLYNNGNHSTTELLKEVTPTGTVKFKNLVEAMLSSGTLDYVCTSGENNYLTFNSSDAMFVRITKDDGNAPTILKAETTYTTTTSGYATILNKTSPTYAFNSKGNYTINLINRSDAACKTFNLHIYDEADLNVSSPSANNKLMEVKINKPSGTAFSDLKIYRSSTKTGHTESQYYIESLEVPLNDSQLAEQGFTTTPLSQDESDTPVPITTGTDTYTFQHKTSSKTNPFQDTFYVVATVLNKTKGFYYYWNYQTPVADIIDVTVADWESNVGYSTTYEVTYSSSTGEEPDPTKEDYEVTGYDGTIVSIEDGIIKGLKAGSTKAYFSLASGRGDPKEITFVITDTPELRKEIRASVESLSMIVGHEQEITFYANPIELFDQDQLEVTITDTTIAEYYDNAVHPLKAGTTTLTISHPSDELADKVIPITVVNPTMYTLTTDIGEGGTITGNLPEYEKDTQASFTISANPNYLIQEIRWNDTTVQITDNKTMSFTYTITKNSKIYARFKVIENPVYLTAEYDSTKGEIIGLMDKYELGQNVNLTVKAKEGFLIESILWNQENIEVTNPNEMAVSHIINADSKITVFFGVVKYPATITPEFNQDQGDVDLGGSYFIGDTSAIIVKAKSGFAIESITWNDKVIEVTNSNEMKISETITQESNSIKVTFKAVEPSKAPLIIGVCCGVGAVAVGIGTFLIIRAKKVGSLKK